MREVGSGHYKDQNVWRSLIINIDNIEGEQEEVKSDYSEILNDARRIEEAGKDKIIKEFV